MEIRLAENEEELRVCAAMMHASAPWNILNFGQQKCRDAFEGSNKENYILIVEGRLAGFAILQTAGAFSGYIQSLCIAPGFRNRQMGAALMRHCEERVFRTMPNVFLCVSSFNTEGQRFYERLGYEKVGELKDHIVRGYDEYLLRKSLGPVAEFNLAS